MDALVRPRRIGIRSDEGVQATLFNRPLNLSLCESGHATSSMTGLSWRIRRRGGAKKIKSHVGLK